MQQEKKRYAAPTLTAHGGAVERTLGSRGSLTEFINFIKEPPHFPPWQSPPARK